jgi:cell division protein FtsI (penicillin-binding protein 3)
MRNRAVTDAFEPGSTIKPLTMSLALEKGVVTPNTVFSGEPFMVGRLRVNDGDHGHAQMTLSEVMQYSSNVGTVKMARQLSNADLHAWFSAAGIGQSIKLPIGGASVGRLRAPELWQDIEKATMSYGYGLSASLLQLARSYTVFTNNGELLPLSIAKSDTPANGVRVMKPEVANTLKDYLERVTEPKGTAPLAQVANYRTAGKTGTARKLTNGGYAEQKYVSSFVGFAPASNPRVIVAIMVDEPGGKFFYGGQVAAPAFANMVSSSMRVLNVQPDAPNRPVVVVPAVAEELQ